MGAFVLVGATTRAARVGVSGGWMVMGTRFLRDRPCLVKNFQDSCHIKFFDIYMEH